MLADLSRVLIIGTGDMGERFAMGLGASGAARELVLADRPGSDLGLRAATVASATDCLVRTTEVDARRQGDIEALLRNERPDLVVTCASLQSPWALVGRTDVLAQGIATAGLGLRLPLQLPPLLAVMGAVREVGHEGPVANLSLPDLTHPILDRIGLAPTVGLGNVSMLLLRVRAAWRARNPDAPEPPLIRVVGHHNHVYDVMQSRPRADRADGPRVWIGEDAARHDQLAYEGPPMAPTIRYNAVTAAAALPVLAALLPGAAPLRWSTPSPDGLPGGYPVRIEAGRIAIDLPDGAGLSDQVAFCQRIGRGDGVERVDDDGTVHFTAEAAAAVRDVAPDLAEPLPLADVDRRAARILDLLG
jgi:hypothetical protein